jgi:hypothetical protein
MDRRHISDVVAYPRSGQPEQTRPSATNCRRVDIGEPFSDRRACFPEFAPSTPAVDRCPIAGGLATTPGRPTAAAAPESIWTCGVNVRPVSGCKW